MWDYTRNDSDASFLHEACSHFTILVPNSKETYADYYRYYRSWRYPDPDTVLIKCDDDIVYMDISKFQGFIDERRTNKDAIMFSPIIVNNPVCQTIQKSVGILSAIDDTPGNYTDFNCSPDYARDIHTLFLEKKEQFLEDLIEKQPYRLWKISTDWGTKQRYNINFIAILGKDFDILFDNDLVETSDEVHLGARAPKVLERSIYIDMHFVVAHMAFTTQRDNGFDEKSLLARYSELVKDFTDTSEGPP